MNPLPELTLDPYASFILVGNGAGLVGKGFGAAIDSFDEIVRFNEFTTYGHERDTGTRTTIWSSHGKGIRPQLTGTPPTRMLHVHGGRGELPPFVSELTPIPAVFYQKVRTLLHEFAWLNGEENLDIIPSTGLVTICFLLLHVKVRKITLVGFDHFNRSLHNGVHHYWDAQKAVLPPKEHDGAAESRLVDTFVKSGKVSYLMSPPPTNFISPGAKVGQHTSVWHYSIIQDDVIVGAYCSVGSRVEISRGVRIGDHTRIASGVFLAPNMQIGSGVFIGPNTTFTDDKWPVAGNSGYQSQPCVIGDNASIGAGCVILPGIRIGARAMVGAGSVVTKDVLPDSVTHDKRSHVMRRKRVGEG